MILFMNLTIDFWLGVVVGAIGIAVLTAIMGAIQEWRARRAMRDHDLTRDPGDRDTRGTSRWELRG